MMNESRLIAARHGIAVASTAYLHAVAYARERLQGTELGKPVSAEQCPIIKHPDVRRMLLQMKAYTEGTRALLLYASYCMDRELMAQSQEERQAWENKTAFLTPVVKAYGSDLSFRITETAMQVYGGYGYVKDYPVEQFLRDEKVHSIFEGTNGIQALDLAGRKLGRDSDALFTGLLEDIHTFCKENTGHQTMAQYVEVLDAARTALTEVSAFLVETQKNDFPLLALYAYPYTELFGDVIVGWLLLWQAVIAQEKLIKLAEEKGISGADGFEKLVLENADAAFYSGKMASARYFVTTVLSLATAKAQVIKTADKAALEIGEHVF
jgi:hypothetical protein